MADTAREKFESEFSSNGSYGWRFETFVNDRGEVEYIDSPTEFAWIGWKSAWKIQHTNTEG